MFKRIEVLHFFGKCALAHRNMQRLKQYTKDKIMVIQATRKKPSFLKVSRNYRSNKVIPLLITQTNHRQLHIIWAESSSEASQPNHYYKNNY